MPRMRYIKPEFFKSEDVSALPLRARLTWIGLWLHCDDHGRFKDNARLIKGEVWSLDDVSLREVSEDLDTLEGCGRIVRYVVDGGPFLAVQNWHHHQMINRPSRPKYPPPPVPIRAPEPGEPGHCPLCWQLWSTTTGGLMEGSLSTQGALIPGRGKGIRNTEGERASAPPPGRPRCKRHEHLPSDDPGPACIACRDARLSAEALTSQPVPIPTWCGKCSEHGRQIELDDDRVARCPTCHPLMRNVTA